MKLWQKKALLFFLSVGFFAVGKNKCAVCAAGFQLVGNGLV
ncbi:hypothetical protein MED217_15620 [Leeuwenhoekiella blandensis MED217]|uniref:Uncharacterized protein n=1 Tax=Leeuwenhoekiella blandensis (strain CECT 7118 / CCUG 51940 / KCTC 22103 / MED217) TaxID=398720 RepID=A3XIB1_LEEBM|nr:hypothetical protein MED217_15620 [Leeuwenhoekiella blandensis MED217]